MNKYRFKVGDFVRNRFTREVGRIVSIPRKDCYIIEYSASAYLDRQTPEHFDHLESTSNFSPRINTILSFQRQ